ncbi:UNVERIFIED_CONTAM: Aldehyde dehydrogenase [Sesamum latifolium]|uniref:Aldehyde dehydrogenase n=1 Tax=Sesamum latifolium TaxID=2727402 RepID=A0AAW2W9X9_9LAMI
MPISRGCSLEAIRSCPRNVLAAFETSWEYMDTSAVKVVEGAVPETTALLEQKWDKIFYTGNSKVGRIILAAAAKHLTPVALELGGKCPVVVDSNINLNCSAFGKVTARRLVAGKWGCNSGQTCVSADYVDALSSELENFYGKDPVQSNDLSSIINSHHFDRLTKLLDDEKVSGKIVLGGQRDKANLKIAPTIILDAPEDSLILNEEIFGPLLPIVTVNKIEDSITLIKAKEKALAAYLFTNDKKLKKEFIRSVSTGGIAINDIIVHLLEPTLPFGGVGESGMGSYHGKFSFDTFSHKKSVLQRGFSGDAAARYPPYTPGKLKFLKAMLSGSILRILRALIAAELSIFQLTLSSNLLPDGFLSENRESRPNLRGGQYAYRLNKNVCFISNYAASHALISDYGSVVLKRGGKGLCLLSVLDLLQYQPFAKIQIQIISERGTELKKGKERVST